MGLQYRHAGTKPDAMILGSDSAAALGAEQARTMARKALGRLSPTGRDPQAHKLASAPGKRQTDAQGPVGDYLAPSNPARSAADSSRPSDT